MNNQTKMGVILLLVAFATREKWTPFVLESGIVETPEVQETTVSDFYAALSKVVRKDEQGLIGTTGAFRSQHQAAAALFAQTEDIPAVEGRREKISRRIVAAIGLEDRVFTDELREELAIALEELSVELK